MTHRTNGRKDDIWRIVDYEPLLYTFIVYVPGTKLGHSLILYGTAIVPKFKLKVEQLGFVVYSTGTLYLRTLVIFYFLSSRDLCCLSDDVGVASL